MALSDRLLGHLSKRGLDITSGLITSHFAHAVKQRDASGANGDDVGTGLFVAVFVVVFTSAIFYGLVQYTLRHVVTTLALIETPTAVVVQRSAPQFDEEADVELSTKEAEAQAFLGSSLPKFTVVNTRPITSKIRATIKHITSHAGWTARWRGMGYGIVYSLSVCSLAGFFAAFTSSIPGASVVTSLLVAVIVAPLHMIWTHAIIALPGVSWKARLASTTASVCFKNLVVPTLVYEGVQRLVLFMSLCMLTLLDPEMAVAPDATPAQKAWTVARLVGGMLLLLMANIFVVLPARAQLVRVEASMLPDNEETIVPFDRSFDGKVVPKVLGGTGAIGFLDAWRSFNREARIRVVKLYVKIFAISVAIVLLVGLVVGSEILLSKHTVKDVVMAARKYAA